MKKNGGSNYQENTTTSFFNLGHLRIPFSWNDGSYSDHTLHRQNPGCFAGRNSHQICKEYQIPSNMTVTDVTVSIPIFFVCVLLFCPSANNHFYDPNYQTNNNQKNPASLSAPPRVLPPQNACLWMCAFDRRHWFGPKVTIASLEMPSAAADSL